jgi:hypothetical protein
MIGCGLGAVGKSVWSLALTPGLALVAIAMSFGAERR